MAQQQDVADQGREEDQQKMLQLAYLQNQANQGINPTLPTAPGPHQPTVQHQAYRRG